MIDALVGFGEPCPELQLEAVFLQALYWSLGSGLEGGDRIRFNDLVQNLSGMPGLDDNPERRAKAGKSRPAQPQRQRLDGTVLSRNRCPRQPGSFNDTG